VISEVDALGTTLRLARPARRVVSLVPSESASVAALSDALVGRTRFCVAPPTIAALPVVGGTKDIDPDAVAALAPDLVLANQEENTKKGILGLRDRGLPVHVSFPKTVADGAAYLATLARLLGVPDHPLVAEAQDAFEDAARRPRTPRRVFVPIWKDPWMTFDGRAFASDLLELCGAENVFSDRPRRYPLAADLGRRDAKPPGDRDTRYPRVTLDEVAARAPELILLPDEPYAFEEEDASVLRAIAPCVFVSGQDLFWYGARQVAALSNLRAALAQGIRR